MLPPLAVPVRIAEFDELFAAVMRFDRPQPTKLDLVLPLQAEAEARDLADRERKCCSFFTFGFEPDGDDMAMHIGVPPSQIEVLDAFEARLAARG